MTRVIASSVLDELELEFGEDALAVCDLDSVRLSCVMRCDDPTDSVILAIAVGKAWIEYRRVAWLREALTAMASCIDKRWNEVPIDEHERPSPTLVIARDQSLEVLYRTAAGVCNAVELSDRPGERVTTPSPRRPHFI